MLGIYVITFEVLHDGWLNGGAVLGIPAKATIKEAHCAVYSLCLQTMNPEHWTGKHYRKCKLHRLSSLSCSQKVLSLSTSLEGLEVTDDVSIVEHLKHPVYITQGSYTNIKVTTSDDLLLAERILKDDS
ncbi:hypothetical protein IFM89_034980 [Coptis chinensis]|uniref:2-C-methyl-D-erythritol 4-phosphate cytidylyltransferase n=1 Tax=Coptis chinensis TaxID=261450 RepID=A0A835M0F6_9MAGN|nr:hypothetical protein IFM89_034980 [Coptis chinensis]